MHGIIEHPSEKFHQVFLIKNQSTDSTESTVLSNTLHMKFHHWVD